MAQRSLGAIVAVIVCTAVVAAAQPVLPPVQTQPSFVVTRFRFVGNTVYTDRQLEDVVRKYEGRPVTAEDLEQARQLLTLKYVNAGYINSGAVLPDQTVGPRGEVVYRIVEGKLSEVPIRFGNIKMQLPFGHEVTLPFHLLRENYVRSRILLGAEPPPLNITKLKDRLELVREDPNIQAVNAELRPGTTPGESYLDTQIQERNPFQVGLQFSNRRPPSVGSTALDLVATDHDLTGRGDVLFARYDIVNGPIDDLRLSGANDYSLDYTVPVTPQDTTIEVGFTRTDALVVEAPFQNLSIKSETDSYSFGLRHPFYRRPISDAGRPSLEIAGFISAAYRENRTELLGRSFSFSPGAANGVERVAPFRVGQEVLTRSQTDAFSVRSTFSFGINALSATPTRDNKPGGEFVAWLGQAQYVHLIHNTNIQFVARAAGQLADRPLLSIEQFAIGGIDTVRGYRENRLVRDEGFVSSIELHVPVIPPRNGVDVLDFIPFVDMGYGVNRQNIPGLHKSEFLPSAGVGLSFTPSTQLSAQIFYGVKLRNVEKLGTDPQDLGIHFNILIQAF